MPEHAVTCDDDQISSAGSSPGLGQQYRRIWLASTLSATGDGMLIVSIPLLAASLTDNTLVIAGASAAARLPWLTFGLLAGVVVDRSHRGRMLWSTDVIRAALASLLALAVAWDVAPLVALYVIVFALGIGETLFDTASQAVLPDVVETDQLEQANGRLFAAQILAATLIGASLGGIVFSVGPSIPLIVDATSFGVSAALLFRLRTIGAPHARPAVPTTVLSDLVVGLRFLVTHRLIRAFAIGAAAINLAEGAVLGVFVVFVHHDLHIGALGYGLILGTSAIGGIIGGLSAGRIVNRLGRSRAVLSAIAAMAVGGLTIALAHEPITAAAGFALFGAAAEVWNVVAVSYRQNAVPPELLGRVMAAYRVISFSAYPLGALLGGLGANLTGLRTTYVLAAACIGAVGIAMLPLRAELAKNQ